MDYFHNPYRGANKELQGFARTATIYYTKINPIWAPSICSSFVVKNKSSPIKNILLQYHHINCFHFMYNYNFINSELVTVLSSNHNILLSYILETIYVTWSRGMSRMSEMLFLRYWQKLFKFLCFILFLALSHPS